MRRICACVSQEHVIHWPDPSGRRGAGNPFEEEYT
jgi:hypothetical protein